MTPKRLGEMCIEAGLLDAAGVDAALQVQQRSGERLGRVLIRTGALPEPAVVRLLGQQLGLRSLDADSVRVHPVVLQQVPAAVAHRLCVLPVGVLPEGGRQVVFVATADPRNAVALQALEALLGTPVRPVVAGDDALRRAVDRHYGAASEAAPPPLATPLTVHAPPQVTAPHQVTAPLHAAAPSTGAVHSPVTAPQQHVGAPGQPFGRQGTGPGLLSLDAPRPGPQTRRDAPPVSARIPPSTQAAPALPAPPLPTMAAPPIPPHQTPGVPKAPLELEATTAVGAWQSLVDQVPQPVVPARTATPPPAISPRLPPPHAVAAQAPALPRAHGAVAPSPPDVLGPEDITGDGPVLVGAHEFLMDANAAAIGLEEVDPNAPPEQPVNAVELVATSMAPRDEGATEEFNPDLIERGPPGAPAGAWTQDDSADGVDATLPDDATSMELASAHEFLDLAAQAARASTADEDPDITLDSVMELDPSPRFSLPPAALPPSASTARTLEMPALTPVPVEGTASIMDAGALPTEERAMPDLGLLGDAAAPAWPLEPAAVDQEQLPSLEPDGLEIPPLTPWSTAGVQTTAADVVTLQVAVAPPGAGAPAVSPPTIEMLRALIVQGLVEDALVETFVLKGLVSREEVDRLKALRK